MFQEHLVGRKAAGQVDFLVSELDEQIMLNLLGEGNPVFFVKGKKTLVESPVVQGVQAQAISWIHSVFFICSPWADVTGN